MDNNQLVVINSGSSSIKFAVYELNSALTRVLHGQVGNLGISPVLKVYDKNQALIKEQHFNKDCNYSFFYELLFSSLKTSQQQFKIQAVGHRVVHGGNDFHAPVLLSDAIVQQLKQYIPFAPLHQPYNIEAIETIARLFPGLSQIACFDTAFHRTHPAVADTFGIPRKLSEEGLKRYGFHGLSYEFIMHQLAIMKAKRRLGRVVIAHLGNGASMCAVREGKSIDSSMGFTALDGLVMGTRCGNLDPGVIFYLLESKTMSAKAIQSLLYKQSGLLGVSEISSDMQELLESTNLQAKQAIELFVYRIRRELGALTAVLGGLDLLVFTGGIGEHAWQIREAVCQNNEWFGLKLDSALNKANELRISEQSSAVDVLVIPTDEDWIIAHHCYQLINNEAKYG
ncbi:Acetate kinase [Legionella massiliensis]|uniref:Acetate kinase n=1 Tax=Legionella massiliensis TaxID=1034943 RepID=A0A078L4Z4_9GAMM|nr:acetate/propionate family kinase [Legionella massiliensis]CDZ78978.1 Acetate kinase [Legionella massiliensis]CEE14716.1 Acetate kinase [Legionella massiliensis]